MHGKEWRGISAAVLSIGMVLLVGCSHSPETATQPTADGSPAAQPARPDAAGIAADITKVNNDPKLSDAQKQIMINQMNHAQSMQQSRPAPR